MAAAAAAQKPAGKTNLIVTIAALTVLAAVGGGIVGKLIVGKLIVASPAADAPMPAAPYAGDIMVRELPASVTNLADPPDMRLRIQVAIVFDKKAIDNPNLMAAQISDDLVAFVKTLTLREMQGASGLQNLREDLNERAAVRSQGKVREVIIETLVVQ